MNVMGDDLDRNESTMLPPPPKRVVICSGLSTASPEVTVIKRYFDCHSSHLQVNVNYHKKNQEIIN